MRVFLCVLLALMGAASTCAPTQAATWTVTRTDDNDACQNLNDCPGTLRDALTRVNHGDEIVFDLPGTGPHTIQLKQGIHRRDPLDFELTSLQVKKNISIRGPGANRLTIRGSGVGTHKIFEVGNATSKLNVTISGLAITNGRNGGVNGSTAGGVGAYNADLTLDGVYVHNNSVTVAMQRSPSGGAQGIRSNAVAMGGGVYVDTNSNVTIRNSTIANNRVSAETDHNFPDYPSSVLMMGGGVANDQGDLTLINTTIHGNFAGYGGGVNNYGEGHTTFQGCTIAANTARKGENDHGYTGQGNGAGVFRNRFGQNRPAGAGGVGRLRFYSTIVALNTSRVHSSGDVEYGAAGTNLSGYIEEAFHNVVPTLIRGAESDGNNIARDPLLDGYNNNADYVPVLRDNGGPVPTISLKFNPAYPNSAQDTSPAIDAGRNYAGTATEGRGQPRQYDFAPVSNTNGTDGADIGAFEMQEPQQTGSTLTVNQASDDNDGVCGARHCTLREAIANANSGGIGVIQFSTSTFPDGTNTAIALNAGLPTITRSVTIQGRGASTLTIRRDSGSGYSLFSVNAPGVNVNINSMLLADGSGSQGGAIFVASKTTVNNVTFNSNTSTGDGGAIFSQNELIVNNSSFNTNSAAGRGGAIAGTGGSIILNNCALAGNTAGGDGGGVYSAGPMAISAGNFAGNTSGTGGGGGIASANRVTVETTVLSGNRATNGGGAVDINGGFLESTRNTFTSNSARSGGGVRIRNASASSPIKLSTFAGNSATDGSGGALLFFNAATLTACTVAFNSASSTGGGVALLFNSANLTLQNTLIAANSAASNPDLDQPAGTTVSGSYNLIQNPNGWTLAGTITGDARLGSLGSFGGPTQTIALRRGSAAIDKGSAFGLSTDQRGTGFARTRDNTAVSPNANDGTDIGAFESQFTDTLQSGPNFEVNNGGDEDDDECSTTHCTLREAVEAANGNADASTITFASALAGQSLSLNIVGDGGLGASALAVSTPVTITGGAGGITLSRSANAPEMRLFRVTTGASLTLQKLWLRGGLIRGGDGESAGGGGGGGGGGLGGAIINEGTLRIEQSTLSGHRAVGGNGGDGGDNSSFNGPGGANSGVFAGRGGAPNGGIGAGFPTAGGFGGGGGGGTNSGEVNGGDRAGGSQNYGYGAQGGIGGGGGGGGSGTIRGGFAPITGAHAGGHRGGGGGGLGLGGAICNKSGSVTIINSTLSGNSVAGGAGGVARTAEGGNGAAGAGVAGAIFNYNGAVSLINATIAFNSGESAYYSIGDGTGNTVSLSAKSSIFSNNSGDIGSQNFENKATVSHTGTFNLIQSGGVTGSNNISGDPRLGPLAENAGVTPTHELLAGSPAIDAGLSTAPHNQDQRGFARIKDEPPTNAPGSDGSDIGAFELQDAPQLSTSLVVNSIEDRTGAVGECTINDCTLREAVNAAASGATIRWKPGVNGTTSLSVNVGRISINKSLSIVGPGASVVTIAGRRDASFVTPIFDIEAGHTVSVSGLKMINGQNISRGGGAIFNAGTLSVDACSFNNNLAPGHIGGGAIHSSGPLTVTGSTFDGNSDGSYTNSNGNGGGAILFAGATSSTPMSVSSSTFTNNSASVGGGLRLVTGTGTVTNCTFVGNSASNVGGGLHNSANMSLSFSTFWNNNASGADGGGGVRQAGGGASLTINHVLAAGNKRGGSTTNSGADLSNLAAISGDYNLIQNATGFTFPATSTHNITGQDALLGPLRQNGGPTQTLALLAGSPAIDRGDPGSTQVLDQRGRPRPVDGDSDGSTLVDIGAFELSYTPPPVVDLNGSGAGLGFSTTFTEGGGAVFIQDANALTVSATDGALSSATVTLSNRLNGSDETLAATPSGAILAADISYSNGVLRITKTAPLADYQAVLRSVRYNNSSNAPSTATRGIDFVVSDGNSDSALATALVSITANDSPPLNTLPGAQSTAEDNALTLGVGRLISVSDADSGTLFIELSATNGTFSLSRTTGLAFEVGDGSDDAFMDFSGTPAQINAALNGLVFTPAANFHGAASLLITTRDGGNNSDVDTLAITVNPVNDAPVLSDIESSTAAFTEDGPAAVVTSSLEAVDVDGGDLAGATVSISGGFAQGQDELVFATQNNITGAFNAATGVLSLSGSAGVTAYRDALRSVTFRNTSQNPSTSVRTISFTVRDSASTSNALTRQVSVAAVNDAPQVLAPATQAATEDTDVVFSAANNNRVAVEDAESTQFQVTLTSTGGTLSLSRTTGLVFSVGDGTRDAAITFIGSGVNVNAALDGLRFHPTANASGSATLTVVVDDRGNSGSGGTLSNSKSVAITIAAQNDAPTIAAPAAISVQEDVASPLAGISFADEDAGANSVGVGFAVASGVLSAESANGVAVVGSGSGTLALSGSIAAINDFITQNRVAFTTASNATANVALSVNINDNGHSGGAAQSATRTVTLQVLAVNDAPVLSLPASYSAAEDTALALAGITVSDVDSAAGTVSLSLSVPAGSGVLRATGNANVGVVGSGTRSIAVSGSVASLNTFLDARSVEFMPALDLNGPVVLSATLSDGGNTGSGGVKTDSKTATITVAARADTPIVSNASTSEDTPSTSGLVITRNANDGAEVSHFQIANITDGALFQTNGTTPIQNGDFITASQGADGLRFTPRANFFGTASFEVRASISGDAAGLGGAPATASISVSAVADTPSVTDASTLEETQTTSGLVISPNAADGNSVSHFKISGISHGRLFHTDGTTEIENNSFITRAQGASGLKFTPALNFNGAASFAVRASISDADAGLGGEAVTATIADTPSVSNASTSEDTQSSGGLVVTPDAADGDSVTHFQIANITNGKLFLANGTTEISGGSFITRAQGVAGLKFSPTANFFGDGSFQVRASISDTDAGLGGAPATATITVSAVAETPGVTGASTSEETQTTGDLVISRGAPDGEEVTHFKVSNISGGRVFLSDGTTEISGGEFISAAQGAAGLKFTPATDFFGTARFEVRGATSSTGAGLGAPATAEISVSAVADTPSVTDASTSEETQTTTGLVISPAAADADSVSHFKISNITSGRLFLNDGRTAIQNGDFISAAQGASGLKFTPALNFNGDASFQVRASTSDADAGLGGAAVTASITVSAVADTPSVTGASTSEDVQSSSGLVITPDVADGASVTHFKILSITNGKLFLADGTTEIENNSFITAAQGLGGLKFTPRANFFGEGSFQVRASTSATDAGLGGEAVTATIEVGAVADTPSATGASTLEETPTTDGLEITRNAVDGAEVTHLKVTAISNGRLFLLNGTTEIESNSFITFAQGAAGLRFAPSANFFGAATFKVQAATSNEDAGLGGDVVTITVTVAAVNDAPELSSADAAALAFTEGDAATRMTPRLVVFDVDSASLVGATVALSGFVAGQDVLGFTNQNNITGAFDAATGVLSLSGSASVDDYQAALRSVTFRNTSENPNTRARSASLRVDDGANDERLSNILTRAIEVESVNDAPQISTPSAQSVDEDTALVFSQTKGNLVSVSDVDVADGDVEVALSVANATLALAKTDGLKFTRGDGSGDAAMKFSGTPAAVNEALDGLAFAPDLNFNGPTALVVSVSDGGLTGSGGAKNAGESVAIAVRAVNDAPTVVAQSVGGREDTPFEITLRATDVDSRDFTFTITDAPQHGTLSGDGATRTFAPARDYNGPDSFSFMASDGALDSNTAVVTVTIGGENDAPVAAPDNASTPEDTPVDVQVLPGDTDIDGDRLAVKSVTTTSDAHGTVSVNANGTLRFVPDDNFNGKSTFTYTVTDGALEDSALVTVQVLAVNDAPVAQSQTVGTSEDTPLKITLVASDIDSPRLTFPIVTPPRFGTLSGSGASLTYTPAPDFNGGDTFAFKANDGDLDSNVALVTITVGGENDAPVAGDDSASTSEDTPAVLRVLDNDRDADGDKMRVVRVATTSATNGTVTISADNTLRFVPTPDFSGASTWSYTISDGQLESSAHVSMEVRAVNDAPTARPDTASTAQGTPIDVQVLANDSDVEGDTLKVVRAATHAGTHGTVSVNADGTLRFVPEANHSGASTFSYVVSDGALESTALVTVQVLASGVVPVAEGAPIAQPDAYVVSGRRLQTAASNGVLRNDTDSSGRAGRGLQAFVASTPRHGLLVLKPDGSFTYTAAATWSGTDSFTYIARGAGGQSAPAKVTLRVGVPIDDTPPIVTLAGAAQRTLIRLPVVRGSAVDTYVLPGRGMVFSSGLKSVVLRLQNPRGLFFNGRTFQTAPFDLATRQAGRSFFELARALPLSVPDGRYTFTAIATDNTGKTGRASQFVTVDATPPLVTLDNPRDSGGNTARIAGFTGLAGRTSGAAQVLVALRRGDGGFWNGRAYQSEPFWLSATLRASTYSLPNASLPGRNNLPPGRYTISVRARDEASNTATIGRTVFVESSAGR